MKLMEVSFQLIMHCVKINVFCMSAKYKPYLERYGPNGVYWADR